MKNLIDIGDLTREEIEQLYDMTVEMKNYPEHFYTALTDKTLLMVFEKPSTRTRVSFEAGMTQMGGHAIYFHTERSQMARGESVKDTSKVISRYVDGVMARVYDHGDLLAMEEHTDVPVINGLTDRLHPCQALSDCFTIREKLGAIAGAEVVFVGDGNNVAHSLMQACAKLGANFTISGPQGYEPGKKLVERARAAAEESGGRVSVVHDPNEAVQGADVLYTDVWVSMGFEDERAEREARFSHYAVDSALVNAAGDPLVMHPLPAHRGKEITNEVMDSANAVVYDQAENRLHVQKALLHELLGER